MNKIQDMLKSVLIEGLKELSKELLSDKNEEFEQEIVTEKNQIENDLGKAQDKLKTGAIDLSATSLSLPNSQRIIRISENLYFCRHFIATTFCNAADFKEDTYPLASNSTFSTVKRGDMANKRGVSLSFPIDRRRIVYPVNKNTGYMQGYSQVDVGPGYEKDYWLTEGRLPKNESGIDQWGRPSVKAGLDCWPQVYADLGYCSFEQAYEKGFSTKLDFLVWNPNTDTKVTGNDIPSGDTREWFNTLPSLESEFFTWRELLKGWNRENSPSPIQIENLQKLTKEILHPTRLVLGPIRVSSGLRDEDTNKRVGGRVNSNHISGRAVDLVPLEVSFKTLYDWLTKNMKNKIRENVWEFPNSNNEHVHLAGPILPGENQNIRIKV